MSRTIRGSKSPGQDFWSRRPYSGRGVGPIPKGMCKRAERQQARNEVREGVQEVLNEPTD